MGFNINLQKKHMHMLSHMFSLLGGAMRRKQNLNKLSGRRVG